MKKLTIVAILAVLCFSMAFAMEKGNINADEAMKLLKEGNERFVTGKAQHPHLDKEWLNKTAKEGQHPFVTMLACSDSRVPVERVFDRGVGDIFVVRVAGNVSGLEVIATTEYAVKHLHTPVIVILGHTHCGAVTASATNAQEDGALPFLLHKINIAVSRVKARYPHLKGEAFVEKCIEENVWVAVEDFFALSPEIQKQVKAGKLKVVGAVYDIKTGKVKWLGSHPLEKKILNSGK